MSPRSSSGLALAACALVLVATTSACDGKSCSEKPDYPEYDEEVVEQIEDLLDEGDVYENQKARIVGLHAAMAPQRAKMRVAREGVRTKMIDELVALQPEPARFRSLIDQMYGIIMPYAYTGEAMMLKAHRMLTEEQRQGIAEPLAEPPDEYDGSFAVNRGIDAALLKIDATEAQEKLVYGWRDKMVKKTDQLYRDQHAQRMVLLEEWLSAKPDPKRVRKHVDIASQQIRTYVHTFGDGAMEITRALTPKQRLWTNQQVNKLRRCEE